jgi:DNA primase
METERSTAVDFYIEVVLPALQERLDVAFPEFGWKRDRQGWVATNQEFTHRVLGVRADRVVAHGPTPRGFLVHGGESVLWTAYMNDGLPARGRDFVSAVRGLAERAGVDPAPLERPRPRDRRLELLHQAFVLAERELLSERGTAARIYLERRGIAPGAIAGCGLGLLPDARRLRAELGRQGYTPRELVASGVLADSRWPGRIIGCWRDERGSARTLWARAIDDGEADGSRYLYLRGAVRASLPPYGLSQVLAGSPELRRELLLVEGVLDVHLLTAHKVESVCALGGTGSRPELFERLARLGVETVTLCLDNDPAGHSATIRAVEQAARARQAPAVRVIDPGELGAAKDPGDHVRVNGIRAWQRLPEQAHCGVAWRAAELLGDLAADADASRRRATFARAGSWLGTLPARLALEQEDALHLIATRTGYSPQAVQRAFQARYWNHTRDRPSSRIRPAPTRELER